jgi:exopolysaccharide biosynthesis protein
MIELGADDALNLDGGGSSAFVYHNSGGEWITNKPSDGAFRPVANHLGFKVAEATASPAPSSDAGQK